MINKNKIGLVTTVFNWDLYEKTKQYFPDGIQLFAIDGSKNFYGLRSLLFFIENLKKYKLDWLVMADEDVVFTKPEKVFDLIDYLSLNDFTVCGMRDGGTIEWRNKNPHMINQFFAVLNLEEIYKIYSRKDILKNQYIESGHEFSQNIVEQLPFQNYDAHSLFEPYYCFYLWLLRRKKKFYYLNGTNPIVGDFATTLLVDHKGSPFLYHTWFARFYRKNKYHTERIDKVIERTEDINRNIAFDRNFTLLTNPFYNIKFFLYKYSRKVVRTIKRI